MLAKHGREFVNLNAFCKRFATAPAIIWRSTSIDNPDSTRPARRRFAPTAPEPGTALGELGDQSAQPKILAPPAGHQPKEGDRPRAQALPVLMHICSCGSVSRASRLFTPTRNVGVTARASALVANTSRWRLCTTAAVSRHESMSHCTPSGTTSRASVRGETADPRARAGTRSPRRRAAARGQGLEHLVGRVGLAPLFETQVVLRADPRTDRHLLPAQPHDASSLATGADTDVFRTDEPAPRPEVVPRGSATPWLILLGRSVRLVRATPPAGP